jgi:hypothetical protein
MEKELVPEQRVDRNGRVVTRYVRADATPASTRIIPKLAAMFGTKREPAEVEARIECVKRNPRFKAMDGKSRKTLLATLHPDTMTILARHGINGESGRTPIPNDIVSYCINNGDFAILNDMAAYIDDHGTFKGDTYDDFEPLTYLIGLQGTFTHIDKTVYLQHYSEADDDQRSAQHALIGATMSLNSEYVRFSESMDGMISRRLNSELTQYLLVNHEKADQIVRVINKRGIEPTGKGLEAIKVIVANGDEIGTTLSEGAL